MNNQINNVIFFTGEAATGKTWISEQLSRYLKVNNHLKPFILHLGDKVRSDQKAGIEPAASFFKKTDNKELLNKDEINELMSHYLEEVSKDANCLLIEGFPKTKDDIDLLSNELKTKFYPEAKISLIALSFKDSEGSIFGMKERQKIPEKQREKLSTDEARLKKQENYINEIVPAIKYFQEINKGNDDISLIDIKLEDNEFFKNFKEGDSFPKSTFEQLVSRLPANLIDHKYEVENAEQNRQFKINFK